MIAKISFAISFGNRITPYPHFETEDYRPRTVIPFSEQTLLFQEFDRLGTNRMNGSQGAIAFLDFVAFQLLTRIRFEQTRRLQKVFDCVPTVVRV